MVKGRKRRNEESKLRKNSRHSVNFRNLYTLNLSKFPIRKVYRHADAPRPYSVQGQPWRAGQILVVCHFFIIKPVIHLWSSYYPTVLKIVSKSLCATQEILSALESCGRCSLFKHNVTWVALRFSFFHV